MRIRVLRTLAACAGVAALGIATAASAAAHPAPFTVKAGSAGPGTTIPFTASAGTVTMKDTTTSVVISCTAVELKGRMNTGNRPSGSRLAVVDGPASVFKNCTGPGGWKFSFTGVGTWYLNIADSTDGVSKGTVSNIIINVKSLDRYICGFTLGSSAAGTGTVAPGTKAASYTNATQTLGSPPASPGALGMWNVKGAGTRNYCLSPVVLKQGNRFSFLAEFAVKADVAAYNPISIN